MRHQPLRWRPAGSPRRRQAISDRFPVSKVLPPSGRSSAVWPLTSRDDLQPYRNTWIKFTMKLERKP
jgi:hypothetical protein